MDDLYSIVLTDKKGNIESETTSFDKILEVVADLLSNPGVL